jgi:prophage maintenance system killer protein
VSRLEVADLVVIAARVLELPPPAVLDLLDVEAAEAALAEAGRWCERDPVAEGAAALVAGLVRHRPLARGNQQVALVAVLQFLVLHGWDLELEPPTAARELLRGVAAGSVDRPELVAWIRARLRPHGKEHTMLERLTRRWDRGVDDASGRFLEQYTDRARRALGLAQEEARGLGHGYLGTEHLLLGLLAEDQGLARRVLNRLDIAAEDARSQVEAIIGRGHRSPAGPIPFTPRGKKVLQLARREAKRLCHNYIGTEHLLLGLVREGEGVAAQVLARLGADRARVVEEVTHMLAGGPPPMTQARRAFFLDELTGLLDEVERLEAEVERLQALLRRHGIEPDGGTTRTA